MSETRQLFGGAITASFPAGFLDASEFRQVPDNQEVLIRNDSDISCIVEVLELATDEGASESMDSAIRFHFGSLAHDNAAISSHIESIHHPDPSEADQVAERTPTPSLLIGTQQIKKFGKSSEPTDVVRIRLALWRLVSKNIDLVMSLNEPLPRGTEASGQPNDELTRSFEASARTLAIKDWSLFV